jgi:hypothetical protein
MRDFLCEATGVNCTTQDASGVSCMLGKTSPQIHDLEIELEEAQERQAGASA